MLQSMCFVYMMLSDGKESLGLNGQFSCFYVPPIFQSRNSCISHLEVIVHAVSSDIQRFYSAMLSKIILRVYNRHITRTHKVFAQLINIKRLSNVHFKFYTLLHLSLCSSPAAMVTIWVFSASKPI